MFFMFLASPVVIRSGLYTMQMNYLLNETGESFSIFGPVHEKSGWIGGSCGGSPHHHKPGKKVCMTNQVSVYYNEFYDYHGIFSATFLTQSLLKGAGTLESVSVSFLSWTVKPMQQTWNSFFNQSICWESVWKPYYSLYLAIRLTYCIHFSSYTDWLREPRDPRCNIQLQTSFFKSKDSFTYPVLDCVPYLVLP